MALGQHVRGADGHTMQSPPQHTHTHTRTHTHTHTHIYIYYAQDPHTCADFSPYNCFSPNVFLVRVCVCVCVWGGGLQVRSHYKATTLAIPMMMRSAPAGGGGGGGGGRRGGGLVVNTNSPGCLVYGVNVAYGMGES